MSRVILSLTAAALAMLCAGYASAMRASQERATAPVPAAPGRPPAAASPDPRVDMQMRVFERRAHVDQILYKGSFGPPERVTLPARGSGLDRLTLQPLARPD